MVCSAAPAVDRARLIVLADMGNEPDEVQQMTHLLMCSSQIDVEGLIAVAGKGMRRAAKEDSKRQIRPDLFHPLIDGYAEAYPNLQLHATGWPVPDDLRDIVAGGQLSYGMGSVGDGMSSAGSERIIAAVTKVDARPVHIVVNAGSNTLAQALYDFRASHTVEELKAFVAKLRVYENQAQDDAGAWINHEFPDILWIRSLRQTRCYGGPDDKNLGPYVWQPYADSTQGQDDWTKKHVRENHGALGELYPPRIFGNKPHFIEGGGTIPWLGLVCWGLTDSSEPSWGGWSGRYTSEKVLNVLTQHKGGDKEEKQYQPFSVYTDVGVKDHWVNPTDGKVYDEEFAPVWRWRLAFWNDFRARMQWCVDPYAKANHPPHAVLNGDATDAIVKVSAKPGEVLTFDASGSTDPDQDSLRYVWWIYREAGRQPYGKELPIENATGEKIKHSVPADAAGNELHLILEVWDQRQNVPLVDYRRIVIRVPAG